MYRGFNLDLDGVDLSKYVSYGKQIHEKNKKEVKTKLSSYKNDNGDLVASEIITGWFPPIKADVFLSHSHTDSDLVIGLSGWLHQKFGLSTFIDSCVWGYSDDLQRMIDDEYCYQTSKGTYNYKKRNRSTSHVHMMLSTALTKMINNCECIIFANTPRSISPKNYIKNGGTTESPWIYFEIAMANLVQKRSPEEHRGSLIKSSIALDRVTESFTIKYDVDLMHLIPLSVADLNEWGRKNHKTGPASLDALYLLKP